MHWPSSFMETSHYSCFKEDFEVSWNYCQRSLLSFFYFSSKALLSFYYSLLYPYLTYCNVAWSFTYCPNLNCIWPLQKRIVRLIAKAGYLANTAPLFCQLRLLDIFSINSFSIAIFMWSYHYNLLQVTFSWLVNDSINIILELPFNIDHIFVELTLKNSVSFMRDLKSEILYQSQ